MHLGGGVEHTTEGHMETLIQGRCIRGSVDIIGVNCVQAGFSLQ
jgi:hypothetical protein